MVRPILNEYNNDLLDHVIYTLELEKYCNYLENQNNLLNLPVVSISKAKEYTEFIIIADRKSLPLISLDDYIKRY